MLDKTDSKVSDFLSSLNLPNDLLKSIISSSPEIGALLYGVWTGIESGLMQKRFLNMVSTLDQEIKLIDKSKIDFDFFQSEEFFDLWLRFVEQARKTRLSEKVSLYSKILVGSSLIENKQIRNSSDEILPMLDDLTVIDLQVAREIYRQQEKITYDFDPSTPNNEVPEEKSELKFVRESGWDTLRETCNINEDTFSVALLKLSRAGLIKEVVGTYASYGGHKYIITPLFQRLIKIISYHKEPLFWSIKT